MATSLEQIVKTEDASHGRAPSTTTVQSSTLASQPDSYNNLWDDIMHDRTLNGIHIVLYTWSSWRPNSSKEQVDGFHWRTNHMWRVLILPWAGCSVGCVMFLIMCSTWNTRMNLHQPLCLFKGEWILLIDLFIGIFVDASSRSTQRHTHTHHFMSVNTYTVLPKVLGHLPWLTYEFKWHSILNP